jgi:hypothetical protein
MRRQRRKREKEQKRQRTKERRDNAREPRKEAIRGDEDVNPAGSKQPAEGSKNQALRTKH